MRTLVLFGLLALLVCSAVGAETLTISTGIILLKDDTTPPANPAARYVKWKSRTKLDPVDHQVVLPAAGSDGDPTSAGATGGGASLTVYNAAGSGEAFTIALPAAGWIRDGMPARTYRFANGQGPIYRVIVRPYKIYVRGGTAGWGYTLDEAQQGLVAARLTLGTGTTWCAAAPPKYPASANDRPDKYLSTKAIAPAACPPLPGE